MISPKIVPKMQRSFPCVRKIVCFAVAPLLFSTVQILLPDFEHRCNKCCKLPNSLLIEPQSKKNTDHHNIFDLVQERLQNHRYNQNTVV